MTRRQASWILGGALSTRLSAQTKMRGTAIHQEVEYKTSPARIYDALLDDKQFSAFTKDTAEIQRQAGGAFKLFGGLIEGRNIEIVPNQRIVQAWRPADWTPGVYSIVKFELAPGNSATRVVLDHTGFTEDKWESLSRGWPAHYWEPLHQYLKA